MDVEKTGNINHLVMYHPLPQVPLLIDHQVPIKRPLPRIPAPNLSPKGVLYHHYHQNAQAFKNISLRISLTTRTIVSLVLLSCTLSLLNPLMTLIFLVLLVNCPLCLIVPRATIPFLLCSTEFLLAQLLIGCLGVM
jgi:hypothetical protein